MKPRDKKHQFEKGELDRPGDIYSDSVLMRNNIPHFWNFREEKWLPLPASQLNNVMFYKEDGEKILLHVNRIVTVSWCYSYDFYIINKNEDGKDKEMITFYFNEFEDEFDDNEDLFIQQEELRGDSEGWKGDNNYYIKLKWRGGFK
jgi:hypothetical protein